MADGNRRANRRKVQVLAAACAASLALAACGEKDEPDPSSVAGTGGNPPSASTTTTTTTPTQTGQPPQGEPTAPAEAPPGDPRRTALEREAEQTARSYVAALGAHDGAAVCRLLAPHALDGFDLPVAGGSCAASLTDSIGYRDPRGFPVWQGARITDIRVAELSANGRSGEVIVSVVTRFADRDEVSIEDDVLYLVRRGERWLVAKPSATLYRAVGKGDIPASVVAPPSG